MKTKSTGLWETIKESSMERIKEGEWQLSHGLILLGLILLSIGLGVGLRPIMGGAVGLVIAGIWLFCGGVCFANIFASKKPAEKKLEAKKPAPKPVEEKPAAKPAEKKLEAKKPTPKPVEEKPAAKPAEKKTAAKKPASRRTAKKK